MNGFSSPTAISEQKQIARHKNSFDRSAVLFVLSLLIAGFGVPIDGLRASVSRGDSNSQASGTDAASMKRAEDQWYENSELTFEPNMGQADPSIRFYARAKNYAVLVRDDAIGIVLPQLPRETIAVGHRPSTNRFPLAQNSIDRHTSDELISIRMVSANHRPNVEAFEQTQAVSSYLIGNNPANWHTGVPHYRRVRERDVFPGVDLVFHGTRTSPEFDWDMAPGADVQSIRFHIQGATASLNHDGDIVVETRMGRIRLAHPLIYQIAKEPGSRPKRNSIRGRYIQLAGNEFGLSVAPYNRSEELVVDPTVTYASYLGGSSEDKVFGVALDSSGNTYLTGETYSGDFPQQPSGQRTFNSSFSLAFITKTDSSGALVFSTYFGGTGGEIGYGIRVDSQNNIYIAGSTSSTDFPTKNAVQSNCTLSQGFCAKAFLSKFDSSGSNLLYSTFFGGNNFDYGSALAIDSNGHAYLAGATQSLQFPVTANAAQGTCLYVRPTQPPYDCTDGFVAKFDTNQSGTASLLYSTYVGDTGGPGSGIQGIAIDSSGNAYAVGQTYATDFHPSQGAYQAPFGGHGEAFVVKINPSGTNFPYVAFVGDGGATGIAADAQGNAYVAGSTGPAFQATAGAYQQSAHGTSDAFVLKLNPQGTAPVYATFLGGGATHTNDDEEAYAIQIDSSGSAYVAGWTNDSDFPALHAVAGYGGGVDAFVAQISPDGSQLLFSSHLGGAGDDHAYALALNPQNGDMAVGGDTESADFLQRTYADGLNGRYGHLFPAPQQPLFAGGQFADGFLVRISPRPFISFVVSGIPTVKCRIPNCTHLTVAQQIAGTRVSNPFIVAVHARTVSGTGEVQIKTVAAGPRLARVTGGQLSPPLPLNESKGEESNSVTLNLVVPKTVKSFVLEFEGTGGKDAHDLIRWGATRKLEVDRTP